MDRKKQNVKKPSLSKNKSTKSKNNVTKSNITSIEKRRQQNNKLDYPKVPTYNRTYNKNNIKTRYTTQTRYNTYNNRNSNYNNRREYNQNNNIAIQTKKIYRAKKKPKNRNISIISKLFTIVMFTIIISYFGVSISKSLNKKPIDYETIEYGAIEDSTQAKGVIIRDEVVYKTSKNGILTFSKGEDERIKKGELVANIKNETEIKTAEEDIALINEKILQLQEQRNELSIFYEDVKKIDDQIQKNLDKSISDLSTYDISKIYELKDTVGKKLTIRNQMLLSENTGSVQDLSSQKALKEQQVNENMENIISNDAGIVSYYIDGLEEVFSFENKDKLTKEQTLMQPKEEPQFKINVLQGDPIFKIVRDNNFYIASYIKSESISSWEQGETRNIYINDNGDLKPLEVIVEKIEAGEKESYVLMKSNKNMIDFIDRRNITFELSKPKKGFKIKLDAIAEEDLLKVPSSYIVDNNITKKTTTGEASVVPIKTSGQDETGEYTYVSISPGMIDIGDYIINPSTKQEIQLNEIFTKKGIYVVNSGIYNFKNIDTEDSVQNDQFIILDPNKNKTIKLYDRYAPDLSVVKGEETTAK
nr:HlyD family efflux transporter periplasmic adaptor subunit [uncultured Tyzzerella sp.]